MMKFTDFKMCLPNRDRREVGFTLIELLVVIAVIAVLAGMIVGVSGVATTKSRLSRAQAQLQKLTTAIESYNADRGSYPPDARFIGTGVINSVTNQLFYELTGTVFGNNQTYFPIAGADPLNRRTARGFFGVDGFQNAARSQEEAKGYLEFSGSDYAELSANPAIRVLASPSTWPSKPIEGVFQNVLGQSITLESLRPIKSPDPLINTINPWQYRASGLNRFNQQSFDLWIDPGDRQEDFQSEQLE